MAMTREKAELSTFKQRLGLRVDFHRYDVLPVINRAVDQSFRREISNKKAIMNRGWYHCHYRLLDHPDVKKNPKEVATASGLAVTISTSGEISSSDLELSSP